MQSSWGCKESDTTERLHFHYTAIQNKHFFLLICFLTHKFFLLPTVYDFHCPVPRKSLFQTGFSQTTQLSLHPLNFTCFHTFCMLRISSSSFAHSTFLYRTHQHFLLFLFLSLFYQPSITEGPNPVSRLQNRSN